jgi:hypothetical protein
MKPYGNVIAVYANRPLLRWSMAIVFALAIYTVAMRRDADKGFALLGMLLMIGIMGVQVAGYIGVTAIQLIWNDRARLTPGVKSAHGPVIAAILLALFSFVVTVGAVSGRDAWGIAAVTAEVMAIGLWIVTARKWWMIPVALYFASLTTFPNGAHPFTTSLIAISAVAAAAWMWKLFVLGGEPMDFTLDFLIRVDSRLFDVVRRVMEIGPMWLISRFHWRRDSLIGRLCRWWPGAGDSWLVILLLVPGYVLALQVQASLNFYLTNDWPIGFPATAMTVLTAIPLLLGLSMVMSRGAVVTMQAIWPVRRREMLAENLTIIVIEVVAAWVLAVIPMLILASRGVELFDRRTTLICVTESAALLALALAALVWLERRAMEIRGVTILVLVFAVEPMLGRFLIRMPNLFVCACVLATVVAAGVVWHDAAFCPGVITSFWVPRFIQSGPILGFRWMSTSST